MVLSITRFHGFQKSSTVLSMLTSLRLNIPKARLKGNGTAMMAFGVSLQISKAAKLRVH